MDDPNQNQVSTQPVSAQPQPVVVPPVSHVEPISGHNKEVGPVADAISAPEVMQPTEVAPELSPEVKEAGVEVKHEVPQLTLADKKAGIALSRESTMYPTTPNGSVKLPAMTEEEAQNTVKVHKKIRESVYWLALTVVRQFGKKAQQPETV